MGRLIDLIIYALADASGMTLDVSPEYVITGQKARVLNFSSVLVEFNSRVVSSKVLDGGDALMITRIKGNLAVLFTVAKEHDWRARAYLLNLAQMEKPDNWLEKHTFASVTEFVTLLEKAVVKSFEIVAKKWAPV
jgi:hypothetical protein